MLSDEINRQIGMDRYKAVVPIPLDRLAWKREHSESELQDVNSFYASKEVWDIQKCYNVMVFPSLRLRVEGDSASEK